MTVVDRSSGRSQVPALEADGLTVLYGGMRAVDNVSVSLNDGERLGIIGPNGAGKSTLLRAIAGEIRPHSGTIRLHGTPLRTGNPWLAVRNGMVRTRQELGLFPTMTVQENVRCAIENGRRSPRRYKRPDVDGLLDRFDLVTVAGMTVRNLPYGTRKLVELARALATEPDILLLDEPAAGLNTAEKTSLVGRLDAILSTSGISLVLVEHDMSTVSALCPDQTMAMVAGRVVASGRFRDVVADPAVVDAYFGSDSEPTAGDVQGAVDNIGPRRPGGGR